MPKVQWTEKKKNAAVQKILSALADEGKSLLAALREKNMPSPWTWYEWLKEDPGLANDYAYATELRAERMFEEILEIADMKTGDEVETEDGKTVVNWEHVQRSRLKVDARKWVLGRMLPRKYGDRLDVTSGNEPFSSNIHVFIRKPEDED